MKNRNVLLFKRIAAQVANRNGLNFGVFMNDHGLNHFLVDEIGQTDGPAEIATKAWRYFCVEEGQFNGFFVGVETTIQFLNETLRRLANPDQLAVAFRDLRSIFNSGGEIQAIREWIKAHYE